MRKKPRPQPSYLHFNHATYAWSKHIDYSKHPEKYQVGKGEQGVLICEPYKSAIGKHWRFKNTALAKISAERIYTLFRNYLEEEDFVGADMARKYLQMGFTRARRYANYKGGNKYDKAKDYHLNERGTGEKEKSQAANVFYHWWKLADNDPVYATLKTGWKILFG